MTQQPLCLRGGWGLKLSWAVATRVDRGEGEGAVKTQF